jgi:hypothetical protein
MFWQSIWLGVQALTDWHILVGMAGIAISLLVWRILIGLLVGNDESGARMAVGCWLEMLGGPVAQALVVCGFILTCFPSILAGRGFTPPAIISDTAPAAIGFALLGCVGVCLLCFIPLVGGFISDTPGVVTFLQGIFIFRPLAETLFERFSHGKHLPNEVFPGFWLCVGYAFVGLVLTYLIMVIAAIANSTVGKMRNSYPDQRPSLWTVLFGMLLGSVCGVIPLLMYGRYLGLALHLHF